MARFWLSVSSRHGQQPGLLHTCADAQHPSHPVDLIDITFDFRSDTPPGLDPDSFSPTLRKYHQLLWSKPLPNGAPFELDVAIPPYLHHLSELGEFWLTSDSVIPSWSKWMRMAHITGQIPEVRARGVHPYRLHDRRDDGLAGQQGRWRDDDQRRAWMGLEDR